MDSFDAICDLVADADPETRGMAAITLARVDDSRATDLLLRMLDDPEKRVRLAAIQSLGDRGDTDATEPLLRFMQSGDADTVHTTLAAFAQLRDPRAFPAVVTALFDSDDETRRNAAAAVGRLHEVRALEPLYAALDDPYVWVRGNAALSIGLLEQESSVERLRALFASEKDEMVRSNVVIALGSCHPDPRDFIVSVLLDTSEPEKVRISAAITLATLSEKGALDDLPSVRDALVEASLDPTAPDEVRASALWALGRTGADDAVTKRLLAALDDPYRWCVLYAVESLGLVADTDAITPLREFMNAHSGDEELIEHIDAALEIMEEGGE